MFSAARAFTAPHPVLAAPHGDAVLPQETTLGGPGTAPKNPGSSLPGEIRADEDAEVMLLRAQIEDQQQRTREAKEAAELARAAAQNPHGLPVSMIEGGMAAQQAQQEAGKLQGEVSGLLSQIQGLMAKLSKVDAMVPEDAAQAKAQVRSAEWTGVMQDMSILCVHAARN